jgi:hypothetical protein
MTQFAVPVVEYDSGTGASMAPLPSFALNDRQLTVGMVRSILTTNCGKQSRYFMAAIVKPTLRFLVDWNAAPALQISSPFINTMRDFSVTTRIGELAQAVSYCYWKWVRGYAWIADFGPWATGMGYVGKKSPDFVMFNLITGDIALMESKGTRSNLYVSSMRRALKQCNAALPNVLATRGYGSILTLSSNFSPATASLHIRDPQTGKAVTDEHRHYVFRRSYASWFDLTGSAEQAASCRRPFSAHGDAPPKISDDVRDQSPASHPLRELTAAAIEFDPGRTSFEMEPVVLKAIFSFQAFKETNWKAFASRMREKRDSGEKAMHFPDGTTIVER